MNQFLKSFLTSLMIGFPAAVFIILFLWWRQAPAPETDYLNYHSQETGDQPSLEEKFEFPDIEPEEAENELQENEPQPVTLSFAGDVYFSELAIENYEKNGIDGLADEEMLELMKSSDRFILNHEFAFSNRGEPMEDKQYTLRTDPRYVSILQDLGTDLVSIANNHILDFGQEAFLDTLDTLQNAQISYIGGGKNIDEASAPEKWEIQGHSIAVFAATRVSPSYDWYAGKDHPGVLQTYDVDRLNQAIAEAEKSFDHTIVFIHWGVERSEVPEEYQRTLAKGYIDAGADLVIGCHPHVLQGFEFYKGVPIVYSLGNYLFGNRTGETVLLQAIFEENGDLTLKLIPCKRVQGVLTRISDPDTLFSHLTEISFGAAVSQGGIVLEN